MTETWNQWEGRVVAGEFPLRQYLGGSDHSAVYLTEYHGPETQNCAIKLTPADPATAELQLSRWNLALKLSHPHLLRLFHMGRCKLDDEYLLYVVMEYAEENLSQLLPHRALTPAEARETLQPVLGALASVHAQGFVHGGLKPANVLAREEQIKISSDRLYHLDEWGGRLMKPGRYDPPEAASGGISPAGDVWSLGMTLVEALTQRPPAWESQGQAEPALPETLPEPFLEIARQCLRRDPQQRCTVAEILARFQPGAPARPVAAAASPSPAVPPPVAAPRAAPLRAAPARVKKTATPVRPQAVLQKLKFRAIDPRYIVAGVGVCLALVGIFAGAKLFSRRGEFQRTASVATEPSPAETRAPSKAQPKSAQKPAARKSAQPASKIVSQEKQSAVRSAPSPASLKSETPTPGLVPGEVLDQVLPDVSQKARDTIRGTVRVSVRVRVDPTGNIIGADFDSPGPSKYFAEQALSAARRWEFAPAKVNGEYVASEWVLRFQYTQAGTRVIPEEASP